MHSDTWATRAIISEEKASLPPYRIGRCDDLNARPLPSITRSQRAWETPWNDVEVERSSLETQDLPVKLRLHWSEFSISEAVYSADGQLVLCVLCADVGGDLLRKGIVTSVSYKHRGCAALPSPSIFSEPRSQGQGLSPLLVRIEFGNIARSRFFVKKLNSCSMKEGMPMKCLQWKASRLPRQTSMSSSCSTEGSESIQRSYLLFLTSKSQSCCTDKSVEFSSRQRVVDSSGTYVKLSSDFINGLT